MDTRYLLDANIDLWIVAALSAGLTLVTNNERNSAVPLH